MKRLTAALLVLAFAPRAPAQSANAAAAEELFAAAQRLMEERKYDEACPKFAESQSLDPGTGTLLNLANCYEEAGLLASAWTTWLSAASSAKTAGQGEREELARGRAAALKPKLGYLTILVAKENRPSGLTVHQDSVELKAATWGTPLPADQGTHVIRTSAPGYEASETTVEVADGRTTEVKVPTLVKSPEPLAGPAGAVQDGPAPVARSTKPLGFVLLGVGVAGLGLGTAFGLMAIDQNNQSFQYCSDADPNLCNDTGIDLRNSALTSGNVSTVAFIAGGVLSVAGLYFVLSSPKAPRAGVHTATLVPVGDGARFVLSGAF